MDTSFEQKVRERAYHIWRDAGMDDGKAHDHWVKAEAAVANETGAPVEAPVKKAAAAKKLVVAKKATGAKKAAPKATAKTSKAKH